jgi:hypothetical protein
LEYALEPREDYEALPLIVVVDYSELDLAVALLDNGGLWRKKR